MSWFSTKCSKLIVLLCIMAVICTMAMGQDNISARRPFGQHTVTFSTAPTFDAGITDSWLMTLTGNVTGSTLVGAEPGMTLTWEICQDGVGGRTFVWPPQLQNPISIPSGANQCVTEIFKFDGVNGNIPTTTTGGGGGGSGTVNGGTVGRLAIYTGSTTVSSDANLDDGLTTVNTLTYSSVGGVAAKQFQGIGTGALTVGGPENVCSGAAALLDVACYGDSVSHTFQVSNNGDSFRSVGTWVTTSPTPHSLLVTATTFPQHGNIPRGLQGQPLCEGGATGDPGFCALNLSSSNNVSGVLSSTFLPTNVVYNNQTNTFTAAGTVDLSAATATGAFRLPVIAGATTTTNGVLNYDPTSNNYHAGVAGSDTKLGIMSGSFVNGNLPKIQLISGNLTLIDSGVPPGGGGGSPPLSSITAASQTNAIANGDNRQTWGCSLSTSGNKCLVFNESVASTASGTPYILDLGSTLSGSTANPWISTVNGGSNGVRMLKSGFLSSSGVGGVDSNLLYCDVTTSTKCFQDIFSNVSAATTRTRTWPDANGSVALGPLTAHGFLLGEGPTSPIVSLNASSPDSIPVQQPGADPVMTAISDCHSATNAVTWNSSTHAWGCNTIAGGGGGGQVNYPSSTPSPDFGVGLSSTAATSVSNTNVATSLLSSFVGRQQILAGSVLPATFGTKTIRESAAGTLTTNTVNFALTVTILLGGQTLGSITVPTTASLNTTWTLDYHFTVTGLTTATGGGCFTFISATNVSTTACSVSSSITGLNFATNQNFDIQATWGTANASNNITASEVTIYPAFGI